MEFFAAPIAKDRPKECVVDGDCQSKLACLGEKCQNPCLEIQPCGENALCDVLDTLPYRTMLCVCPPGYEGDAKTVCRKRGMRDENIDCMRAYD